MSNIIQSTVALIKPDAFDRKLVGILLAEIESHETLQINSAWIHKWSLNRATQFYGRQHNGKPYFSDLVEHMSSGPLMQIVLTGPFAIQNWRELLARLRGRYVDNKYIGPRNLLHGSDSNESYLWEAGVLLS